MLVYVDRTTGEDHISDAYDTQEMEEYEGEIIKVKCKWSRYSDNEDVQLSGANPSAEDGEECCGSEETTERKLDVQHFFRQCECTYFTKKGFKEYLTEEANMQRWKGFIKDHLEEHAISVSDEDVEASWKKFKLNFTKFVKFILTNWKNVMIFQDSKEDFEGAKCFYVGNEDGDYMYYIKAWYRCDKN